MPRPIDLIGPAVPFFFLLIGIELAAALIARKSLYRLNDSISDLSLGIYSVITGLFTKGLIFGLYIYVYNNFSIFSISVYSVAAWIACFFAVEFTYYWFHRKSHEIGILWGGHEPHHSSEEYNLSVALRQGTFQQAFGWMFDLPLALIGFPPFMYAIHRQVNTLYQFWIHTRLIGKLGPLEWFLNTPSHHRVHHGRNPKYIDKNHGGTLIIWDRLFGTFQKEEEEPVYGTVKPLASWNPVWANVQYYEHMIRVGAQATHFIDRILIWFKPPGWSPRNLRTTDDPGIPEVDAATAVKFDTQIPKGLNIYLFVQFVFTLGITVSLLFARNPFELEKILLGLFSLFSLMVIGGLFEMKRYAKYLEPVRLLIFGGIVYHLFSANLSGTFQIAAAAGIAACIGAFVFWIFRYRF